MDEEWAHEARPNGEHSLAALAVILTQLGYSITGTVAPLFALLMPIYVLTGTAGIKKYS